jgi:hypothetical protein
LRNAIGRKNLEAFQQALSRLGYAKGRNYVLDARFADTDQSRLPTLAKKLVDRGAGDLALRSPSGLHQQR